MDVWAQYGLLGLVLAGIGTGLAGAGLGAYKLAGYVLKNIVKPISDKHIEFLTVCIATLRQIEAGLKVITETANELREFRNETMDIEKPYSAVKAERGISILGEMVALLVPSGRESEMDRLQRQLAEALRR